MRLPIVGPQSAILDCVCWDKDRFSKDYMGEFEVVLTELFTAGKTTLEPRWYPLKSKKPGLMSRMKFKMTNNKDEFCDMVRTGNVETIKEMIHRGASANTENSLGRTALIIAAANGHKDVTKLLLKNGARPDTVAEGGDTALSMAVLREYDDIAELLLRRGANPNAAANYGTTALAQAAATFVGRSESP